MQTKLEQEIMRLKPELDAEQVHNLALDIGEYWIDGCLPDVLEAMS